MKKSLAKAIKSDKVNKPFLKTEEEVSSFMKDPAHKHLFDSSLTSLAKVVMTTLRDRWMVHPYSESAEIQKAVLGTMFDVSPEAIRRCFTELRDSGYIHTQERSGGFIFEIIGLTPSLDELLKCAFDTRKLIPGPQVPRTQKECREANYVCKPRHVGVNRFYGSPLVARPAADHKEIYTEDLSELWDKMLANLPDEQKKTPVETTKMSSQKLCEGAIYNNMSNINHEVIASSKLLLAAGAANGSKKKAEGLAEKPVFPRGAFSGASASEPKMSKSLSSPDKTIAGVRLTKANKLLAAFSKRERMKPCEYTYTQHELSWLIEWEKHFPKTTAQRWPQVYQGQPAVQFIAQFKHMVGLLGPERVQEFFAFLFSKWILVRQHLSWLKEYPDILQIVKYKKSLVPYLDFGLDDKREKAGEYVPRDNLSTETDSAGLQQMIAKQRESMERLFGKDA